MALLFADENFPLPVVELPRALGHAVLTIHEAGKADQAIPDKDVLTFAIAQNRAVLTMNRRHFVGLHAETSGHTGIIVCTFDPDFAAQAERIHASIQTESPLAGKLVRVNRPPR